jgi:hypothetical protein
VSDGTVDRAADRGRQRDQDDFGALAADSEDAMAVFLAVAGNVGARGFEDPQAEEAEHRDEGEVVRAGRFASSGEHCFELQVRESQGGRLGRHRWLTDVLGWRMLLDGVDDRGPVEPCEHREPPRNRGWLEAAGFLHPPDIQLQVRPGCH